MTRVVVEIDAQFKAEFEIPFTEYLFYWLTGTRILLPNLQLKYDNDGTIPYRTNDDGLFVVIAPVSRAMPRPS